MYVYVCVCACVRACVRACMHACMYVCMYVCIIDVKTNNKTPPTCFELDGASCRAVKELSVDTNRVSLRQLLAAQ